MLSGDVHFSEFRLISAADGGYALPELTSSPLANSNDICENDAEVQGSCFDSANYFVGVEVDTTLEDPTIQASIYGNSGVSLTAWTIPLSQLKAD